MKILAIETSCDETAVAVVENGATVLTSLVASQIATHQKHGGVVPELASRMHTEKLHGLLDRALKETGLSFNDIDACAVTQGPGLEGSLLVGIAAAKTLSHLLEIPLINVNHLHGHIYANFLSNPPVFPFICLIVSGGHTQLIHAKGHMDFELLGETRDDAAGEAFDKVARSLNLGYPGGPAIEKAAQTGNEKAFKFPKAMLNSPYEFSFSGLKTAVIQTLRKLEQPWPVADLAASFQKAVVDVLTKKAYDACRHLGIKTLVLSGGVAANTALRNACQALPVDLHIPESIYCTDNAAMIGAAAYYATIA